MSNNATLSPARRAQLLALSPLGQSVLAAEKYQRAIKAGVDQATKNNAQPLVRQAKDGGRNAATERAAAGQRHDDPTTPYGPDPTRDSRDVGKYAAAIGDPTTKPKRGRMVNQDASATGTVVTGSGRGS